MYTVGKHVFHKLQQLPPTIQGSEASHDHGLEQTLFERLTLMVGVSHTTSHDLIITSL